MKSIAIALLAAIALAFAAPLASLAFAQDAGAAVAPATPDPTVDPTGFAGQLYNAFHGHQWLLLAALALVGVVAMVRKFGSKIPGKFGAAIASNRGGAVLSLLLGTVGGLVTALAAGKGVSWKLMLDGLVIGFTASGGWTAVKHILGWSDAGQAAAK